MLKNIVFDFDGTLADTLDLALAFGNENQTRFSKIKITKEEFRKRSMREVLTYIGLTWYKLPQFVFEMKHHLNTHLYKVSLFPAIPNLIRDLRNQGFELYILSSNSRKNIEGILTRFGLESFFRDIFSDSSVFGKQVALRRLFTKWQLESIHTIYVADEVRDVEACRKIGIRMIAVAWGWNSIAKLRQIHNLVIAETVEDLRLLLIKECQTGIAPISTRPL